MGVFLLPLDLGLLGNANKPVKEDGPGRVEDDIGPQEPEVAPSVIKIDIDTSKKCVGVGKRAVVALLGTHATVANQVPAPRRNVLVQELGTGGRSVPGRLKCYDLVGGTLHWGVGQCRAHKSFDDVCQRIDPVHEDPEAWQLIRAGENAAKYEHHDEEQVHDASGDVGVGGSGDQQMSERGRKQEEHPDMEEDADAADMHLVGPLSVPVQSNGIVPADETKDRDELPVVSMHGRATARGGSLPNSRQSQPTYSQS